MDLIEAEKELRDRVGKTPGWVVGVDLDGTLAEYDGWKGFLHIGKPRSAVVDVVREEFARGSRIIIHTARVTTISNKIIPQVLEAVRLWLIENSIPFTEIWAGTGKPFCDFYLDDHAVNIDCQSCNERFDVKRNNATRRTL